MKNTSLTFRWQTNTREENKWYLAPGMSKDEWITMVTKMAFLPTVLYSKDYICWVTDSPVCWEFSGRRLCLFSIVFLFNIAIFPKFTWRRNGDQRVPHLCVMKSAQVRWLRKCGRTSAEFDPDSFPPLWVLHTSNQFIPLLLVSECISSDCVTVMRFSNVLQGHTLIAEKMTGSLFLHRVWSEHRISQT